MVPEVRIRSLHHPVRQFSDLSENRSKSARVRAICNHAWTWRTPSAARIRRIQQNLSGRDLARSMNHRRKFACSWNLVVHVKAAIFQASSGKTVSLAHPAARFARAFRNLRRNLQFAAVCSRGLNFYQGTRIVES